MAENKKRSMLNGALILSFAVIAVKIISVLFKYYVTQKIGYEAKGHYAVAYNIYTPVYTIALAGLPSAVAKIVAEKMAEKKYKDAKALFKITLTAFIITGILGTIAIVAAAYPFAKSVGSTDAIPSILAIAPSVFFCCVMSGYRGYYQGLKDMSPTSVSQVIEALGKLIFGWLFINLVAAAGTAFADSIPVLNTIVSDKVSAYSSAAALSGVTVGSVFALLYLMVMHKLRGSGITAAQLSSSPERTPTKQLIKELWVITLPIAIGALVSNFTTLIDNWTVLYCLKGVLNNSYDTVSAMYPGIVEARGFTPELASDFKSYLFGAYDTVLEIKNIIPTFTITFGISAIPFISAAWATGDKEKAKSSISVVIRSIMLMALPAGLGLFAFADDILWILYGNSPVNAPAIPYITPILMWYGISVLFLALVQPLTSVLQSINKTKAPIAIIAVAAAVKIIVNVVLVSIPSVNIQGAVFGSICFNVIFVIAALVIIKKEADVKYELKDLLIKPLVCSFIAVGISYLAQTLLCRVLPDLGTIHYLSARNISLVIAIALAVIIYALALLITKTVRRSDIIMLPMGEKIAKLLEKCRLLG